MTEEQQIETLIALAKGSILKVYADYIHYIVNEADDYL